MKLQAANAAPPIIPMLCGLRVDERLKTETAMSAATRERKLAGWARAVKGVLASDEGE